MDNEKLKEAADLVARIMAHQQAGGITDAVFVSRHRGTTGKLLLGSDRTWQRMRENDWRELSLDKWLPRLRETAALLDGGSRVENVITDLPWFRLAAKRLISLEGANNDRRIMVILAPSGVGKSVFLRWACAPERGEIATSRRFFRFNPSLRNRGTNICQALVERLVPSETGKHSGYKAVLDVIIRFLRNNPCTLFFDEAHEGGLELLKLMRTFVDESGSRFVYSAYPTEWDRVVGADVGAIAEGRQFVRRVAKPILDDYRGGTTAADAAVILERNAGLKKADALALADQVVHTLRLAENLSTLDDGIAEALRRADDDDGEVTTETVRRAIQEAAREDRRQSKVNGKT